MTLILPFEIRPYVPSDRSRLIATINAICAEGEWTYTDQFQPTAAWHHAFAEPDCPCHRLFVINGPKEEIIGWSDLFRSKNHREAVLGIGILASYRGQGLGTKLLVHVLEWADAQHFIKLTLIVRNDNARAIHLYQNFGFQMNRIVVPPVLAKGQWSEMVLQF